MLNHTTKKVLTLRCTSLVISFALCVCVYGLKGLGEPQRAAGRKSFASPFLFQCLRRRERESRVDHPVHSIADTYISSLSLKSHRWLSRTCSSSSSSPSWPLECVSPSSHLQLCDFPSSRTSRQPSSSFFFFNKNAIRNKRNKCVLLHNNSRARHRRDGKLGWGGKHHQNDDGLDI